MGLEARPPPALGQGLELRAQLEGASANALAQWSGQLYAQLGYTDLAAWRAWVDYPVEVGRGQGALRLWATLERGQLVRGTADVALAGVSARLAKDLPPLELAALSGRVEGVRRARGYQVSGRQLALAPQEGPAMAPTDFSFSWQPAGREPEQGRLEAKLLELEPLARLAGALPLPAKVRQLLGELQPRGQLLDARMEWSGPLADATRIHGRGRFTGLSANAWHEVPGFTGLSGSIDATEAGGSLTLASRGAEVLLPRVFPDPRVKLDSLEGQVAWQRRSPKGVALQIASLGFANASLEGEASGTYLYTGEGPGTINLRGSFVRADAAALKRYLPRPEIMGGEVRDWLAGAILAGKASDVRLRLRGDLRDFPFSDPARGEFRVSAHVEKGVLEYVKGWPRIANIDGELLFEREEMQILGHGGTILGAKVSAVRVSIPDLGAHRRTHLLVEGRAEGPSAEFLKFIEASPVRGMIGGFTDAMAAAGQGTLDLKLDLPLGDLKAAKVNGEYAFSGNTLTLTDALPPLERAAGKLAFTENSIAVRQAQGRLFGGMVTASGGTNPDGAVRIVAKGDAALAGLRTLFDHPLLRHVSGSVPYVATVTLDEGRARVSIQSSLRGLSSALPPPLAKNAADALPLHVELLPGRNGARDRISVKLGGLAAAEILRRRRGESMSVQRASVWLSPSGKEQVRLPERPGTLVYGELASLDVDRWLPYFSESEGDGGVPRGAVAFDLRFGTLDAYGKRLNNVALRAGLDEAGWSASVQSREITGDVSYRNEKGGLLSARLADLRIPEDSPGAKPRDSVRSRDFPAVDLIAERFHFRGRELGRLELGAQRAGEDWQIDKLVLVNSDGSLSGRGLWHNGTLTSTGLSLELEASDAGKFLGRAGYPDLVRGGKARLRSSVSWKGDPTSIDYRSLSGWVELKADEGQFLEIEPGIGKLISLMSLQALPKRLTLDFRDVFSKGFRFEKIRSSAHINNGVMTLQDFTMKGSAAKVDMSGTVNLASETQDLSVRVLPSLGDTASTVIGVLAPLFAIPALIVQRALKDPLGHIFAFDYSVTGNWSDPHVKRKGFREERAADLPQGVNP
jgi:uncharacterized protein (TIGR02099 family)